MRWSTKGRYAVNAMVDLALRESTGPVALAAIAQRQRISLSYLEQLFARLRQQGLVASSRGPGGGYVLGRALAEISAADIVRAVEVSLADSSAAESDPAAGLWCDLGDVMLDHLATVPLQRLVDAQLAQGFVPEDKPTRRQPPAIAKPKPMRTLAPNSVFALGQRIGA